MITDTTQLPDRTEEFVPALAGHLTGQPASDFNPGDTIMAFYWRFPGEPFLKCGWAVRSADGQYCATVENESEVFTSALDCALWLRPRIAQL